MSKELIEEIIAKASQLPAELQREALAFVESLAARRKQTEIRSIKGILSCNLGTLEEDLAEARREMWKNFPREEPK
ncbi:MAG: hypothetical protein AB1631_08815 [Acidobacteriota bacterium]